ncbi:MAG: ATP-dependent sacrificial sulfur transferase LarE [Chloroflexi bacterium]|nr:ATP-dependent sacrificial sulfur transferase LarE [Chloroflexota bacterium]
MTDTSFALGLDNTTNRLYNPASWVPPFLEYGDGTPFIFVCFACGVITLNIQDIEYKRQKLEAIIQSLDSVVVAFSGGVDSTYLLAACLDTLGQERVLAVTADSETYPRRELVEAQGLARLLGARQQVIHTHELDDPRFANNPPDRCYFCKGTLFTRLQAIAHDAELAHVVYGGNADDRGDYRPGRQAAKEAAARAPLEEAGLNKDEIRELSRQRGLPTWDKPSYACLSSRFPYGLALTPDALHQVEAAEEFLRHEFGVGQLRVRHHDTIARIEVQPEVWPRLVANGQAERIVNELHRLGYLYVTLDLAGFRSGSMNDTLDQTI